MIYYDKKRKTYYFRVYRDVNGVSKQFWRRGFTTKTEAKEAERLFTPKIEELSNKKNVLFQVPLNDYFVELKKKCKLSTFDSKMYCFERIKDYFKNKTILSITTNDVKKFQNSLIKLNLSNQRINRIIYNLSCYFDYLIVFYNLQENPCLKISKLYTKGTLINDVQSNIRVLERNEYNLFTNTFSNHDILYKCLFEVMYKCGTRISETRAIKWKDFDFTNHTLQINKQKYKDGLTTTKSKKSDRLINLCSSLEKLIKEYKAIEEQKYNDIDSAFVFGGMSPVSEHAIRFQRVKHERLTNIKEYTNHEFRHSFGSNLLADGFDIKYVSQQMGHESIAITLRVYHHLLSSINEVNKNRYFEY